MDPQVVFEWLKALAELVWSFDGVKIIASHTVVNVVVAIAAAQKTQELELGRVGEFLYRKLLPYVSVYFILIACGEAAGLAFLAPVAWAAIEASLTGDLMDNLARLGLKWPEWVARMVVKR